MSQKFDPLLYDLLELCLPAGGIDYYRTDLLKYDRVAESEDLYLT